MASFVRGEDELYLALWLATRVARWRYLAREGLPGVYRKKIVFFPYIINPLLTKIVRSKWLDIGLFLASLWAEPVSRSINAQKRTSYQIRQNVALSISVYFSEKNYRNVVNSWLKEMTGKSYWLGLIFNIKFLSIETCNEKLYVDVRTQTVDGSSNSPNYYY